MVKLHELKPFSKARKRRKKVGRGNGSGHGTYSGRGVKGQRARSGGRVRPGFEGGRTPLIRQIPKMRGKGFKGDKTPVSEVKLSDLATHFGDNETVTPDTLKERGLVENKRRVKILGTGELQDRKLNVVDVPITKSAKEAIEEAGGKVEQPES